MANCRCKIRLDMFVGPYDGRGMRMGSPGLHTATRKRGALRECRRHVLKSTWADMDTEQTCSSIAEHATWTN